MKVGIICSGLTGATVARQLAEINLGESVMIIDSNDLDAEKIQYLRGIERLYKDIEFKLNRLQQPPYPFSQHKPFKCKGKHQYEKHIQGDNAYWICECGKKL